MTKKDYADFQWIDLASPNKQELQELADRFGLDLNLLEDSIEYGHLPKIEKLSDYTFVILRGYAARLDIRLTTVGELSNKIAFFINEKNLITIHRAEFDFLKTIGSRATSSESLMLEIFNEMLLTYEAPAQAQNEQMDLFEQEIFLRNGGAISIEALYFQKTRARLSKKILQLTQNVLNQITVKPENSSDLQDLKDTAVSLLLQYDEVVEDSSALLNSYLSIAAQKNNDVMKLLTIFSAFFLPLTFLAGIYGMNFDNMPELRWHYGYFFTLGVMLFIAALIYGWFKQRKIM